jgi:2-dehydro-3-deoxyphosphogluconate aldolase / (4S)-4-hydroxy-2-oxoglutarate aldolase
MERSRVIDTISRGRIVAILRGDFAGCEVEIASTLFDAGLTAVEVTLNSRGALDAIRKIADRLGTKMAVGAGTVLHAQDVEQVAMSGGSFIVSPNRDLRVIEATRRHDLVSIPGCFTPSEVLEALDAGADAAKLFPASVLGPGFVRAMRSPLPDVRLIPTGGVTSSNAAEYIAAGAWAIGVGSELVGRDVLGTDGLELLSARAKSFVVSVRSGESNESKP